uniref:Retrovirus-related Pol polyprotein from transposon TNT 1-94 n=1 Tax=Tanacetum cinerariifolium TaxID=118510 RepID=A0A6L2NKP7_TANCI|nr:retrovirus-related Pol polyprotein from transposon TNT 1-94 [Tanacetum cinerariifolium]
MCDTAKDIWNSLIITHQGNKQVKDNKIDLLVQKYEVLIISDDRTIDCAFARFNTIVTSLKALDESFASRNHVRKFLKALPTKWRPKVTKENYKSLGLKARKVLSEEEATSSDRNDEEYAMAVTDFKKFVRRRGKLVRQPHDDKRNFWKAKEDKKEKDDRRCFKCGDPNHFISDCPKHSTNDQKAFVVGCWSDSEVDFKKEEICLMALDDIENFPWKNSLSASQMEKALLRYFKVFGSKCFILNTKDYLTKFDPKSTEGIFLRYSPNRKAYVILNRETMRVEESLNVKFDKSPQPETPPLEDDDVLENENIEKQEKDLEIKENEPLNIEILNIKESKDHPLETVIGNLNKRTLRSQEELKQFKTDDVWSLVPPLENQSIRGTKWVFKNKLDENGIISRNKAKLAAQGYNQQEGIDFDETYTPVARLESIRILFAYACAHDFKLY